MPEPQTSRSDPLRHLRAFAQVARLGSVSRAAEALGISQPAVSLQLQALSREHGVVLLQRSGRRLVPTAAGQALLALARPLVDGIDGLGTALQARLQAQSAEALSIATGGVALCRLLPPVMHAWTGGPVRLEHAPGTDALERLRAGDSELAVGSWLDVPGDIEVQPLLSSPACLVVPVTHPLAGIESPSMDDLASHGLVLPANRRTTRQLVDLAYGRAGMALVVTREAADWPAVLQLVALGQGITISTSLAAPTNDPRLVTRPLPSLFPARPYGIALRRGRTPAPPARQFIDALHHAANSIKAGLTPDT